MSESGWLEEVTWAGGYLFVGTDAQGHSIVFDSAEPVPKGTSPMNALLASLGACSGMDIVAILRKRKQKLNSLKVQLKGERPDYGYPKPWKSVHVKYLLSGEDLDRATVERAIEESMSKFCSVAATIRPGVKITHSYELTQ